MVTQLIMLILLTCPLFAVLMINKVSRCQRLRPASAAVLGITLVFCMTGVGHFIETQAMAEMLPTWVPLRTLLVYVTGVVELVAAFGLWVPRWRVRVGWGLMVMLVGFLPVNIYAALNQVGMGGHQWGPVYLLIRIPLQAVLVLWIWHFVARRRSGQGGL